MSLFRPLPHAGDHLAQDSLSTPDGSCRTHSLDSAAQASTTLPSLNDRDPEGHHPDGAGAPCTDVLTLRYRVPEENCHDGTAVSGTSFTASSAERTTTDTDAIRKAGIAVQTSDSASGHTSRHTLLQSKTTCGPPKPMTGTPSSSSLGNVETPAPLMPDTRAVQKPNEPMTADGHLAPNGNRGDPPEAGRPMEAGETNTAADIEDMPLLSKCYAPGTPAQDVSLHAHLSPLCDAKVMDTDDSAALSLLPRSRNEGHPLASFPAAQPVKSQRDQGFQRPPRHSQCRPPECSAAQPDKSRRIHATPTTATKSMPPA
ncbi:uncharacterized protein LOC119378377 [Rhipicephalus sanguineus]|uniref:uncharacterized protein LOC119378377 n=1 Tax=Rhipicephalus sanguineus TaxID=34632 RepID=UPI001895DA64|nr:uncharacterized protein LOC119378377 [Rhipicephalus sanguineus]